ncbi:TPA: GIY-YIG nuclease family protein [Providencia rettgeri]
MSGNLRQRVDTLKQQHNASLRFISIIPAGGVETESALHLFFKKYRLNKKGLGREWFSYTDELREFIDTLKPQGNPPPSRLSKTKLITTPWHSTVRAATSKKPPKPSRACYKGLRVII